MKGVFVIAAALLAAACQGNQPRMKAIVGVALHNPPDPAIQHAVVIVKDGVISALGEQQSVPVPARAEKTSGVGKSILPEAGARLRVGGPADLLFGTGAPHDFRIERRMRAGEWVQP